MQRRLESDAVRNGGDSMVIKETMDTPVMGEYDAVVVGAGPAGCGAALALGRSGCKTLLIEKFNCLGGAWTTGFMNPFFDYENKKITNCEE